MARKKKESKGLGDTLKNVFDATGITKVVETVTEAVGIGDCGCSKRQEILNNLFPYSVNENQMTPTESTVMIVDNVEVAVFN